METIQKFQNLLRDLFQFETSDLDFGIYRILNYKRDQVERFIEKDLVDKVESAFAKHKDERLLNITQRFEEASQKVIQALNPDVFTPTGDLREEFKNTQVGREYLSLKAQRDEAQTLDEIKLQVFNDLHSFFSRFYEEGDFVPQYRYSIKGHKYAIPYNGEEVKLYWANQDQYYTKTGLLFRDYTFKAGDYKIVFRIVSAREELGSKKATKERFFVLDDENPIESISSPLVGEGKDEGAVKSRAIVIRFQYRELTEKEVKSYGVEGGSNTSKQEKINQATYGEVLQRIKDAELKAFLSKERKSVLSKSEGTEKPLLLYQLSRFAAKNTKDYFIHKSLKKFLSEQLDYFIKAEILSIDTLEKERFLDKHITRAKVVREIGEDIIEFLSQIEDFQKRLWEKKKFVLKTEYVITTDRVPREFYEKIWSNQQQKEEWEELGFNIPKTSQDLEKTKFPIDTKHFTQEFREKLLEKLTEKENLDDLLDGLLIKSENWQALNLLIGKYGERVQTIYIDPPFNTGTNEFLYRNNLLNSTWLAMLSDRLIEGRTFLHEKGSFFARIDHHGDFYVRQLLNSAFGEGMFQNQIVLKRGRETAGTRGKLEITSETLLWFSRTTNPQFYEIAIPRPISQVQWTAFLMGGERHPRERAFLGKTLIPPKEQHFALSQPKVDKLLDEHFLRLRCRKCGAIYFKAANDERLQKQMKQKEHRYKFYDITPQKVIHGVQAIDYCLECKGDEWTVDYLGAPTENVSNLWIDIESYSRSVGFFTENSEALLKRVIELSSTRGEWVLDYFLGSGTTTAVAQKTRRKWVGVEMGGHFETIVMPRMKRVLLGEQIGVSNEVGWNGGGFFKYQILEQYEDTLDNIELTPNKQAQLKFGDEYLLKYFLDYETRENPSLLNVEHLRRPFAYKLRVNLEEVGEPQEMVVDIPETFNYLLSLKVSKVKVRHNGRKYVFTLGEKEGKNIAVVWRDYDDEWGEDEFKQDKEFIIQELQPWAPHIVYVNGQSILTPKLGEHTVEIRHIEPEFRRLMG
jgi:adenine-specific DNA-methyltransferase